MTSVLSSMRIPNVSKREALSAKKQTTRYKGRSSNTWSVTQSKLCHAIIALGRQDGSISNKLLLVSNQTPFFNSWHGESILRHTVCRITLERTVYDSSNENPRLVSFKAVCLTWSGSWSKSKRSKNDAPRNDVITDSAKIICFFKITPTQQSFVVKFFGLRYQLPFPL